MSRPSVFISHSSADVVVARQLRDMLAAAGYSCWMAPDDVTGTDPWATQILAAIEGSRAMIVLVSARSNGSTHVAREVELASSRGRIILPLRLEPVAPAGALEYHLAGLQRIDAFPPPIHRHRDEILRRLALTVPLEPEAGDSTAGIAGAAATAGRSPEGRNRGTHDGPSRQPAGGGGLSAWARANSMLAGSIVTLAALFLVATLAFAFSGSPEPTASPSEPNGSSTATMLPESLAPTVVPTASPTAPPVTTPLPSLPPPSGGPFPNEAEQALYDRLPESGRTDIIECERQDSLFAGAVVGITCHADDGELLFYEGYPDATAQRRQYLDSVRSVGNPEGSCATSPEGDSTWDRPDGHFGHVSCGVNDLGLYYFLWTDESTLVSVSWYAGYDVDLEAERANGYQTFLNWIGG